MTLLRFATKNAFRNLRRTLLTGLSIAFSFLLLTLLMSVYRGFYLDQGSEGANLRLITHHRIAMEHFMPSHYREKIRAVPGVVHVAPWNWFGGIYKDDRPENTFTQFTTDPKEIFQVLSSYKVPPDQLEALQRDRGGCAVAKSLADKFGWKIGDHITLRGRLYRVNPELTVRAIYEPDDVYGHLLFNSEYIEQAIPPVKGITQFFFIRVDSPDSVARVSREIDAMFQNSPQPTKTDTVKAFTLSFISKLGNVKLFILCIAAAVVFSILLMSANTIAMSIRERTREVAVLKTLGFTRGTILSLYVGEAMTISLAGGLLGTLAAYALLTMAPRLPNGTLFSSFKVTGATAAAALFVAALAGMASAFIPALRASRRNISDGLRHIG